MKKKLPIILLGVILACVLVFGFLYANNDIGKTANSLEADIRQSQKILDDWIVDGSISDTMAAFISYPQDKTDHTFSVYVNRPGLSFGYFFRGGGDIVEVDDYIAEFVVEGNNERAFISMNTQNIVRLEVDDGNGIQVIDIDSGKPFAIVLPLNVGNICFYDTNGNGCYLYQGRDVKEDKDKSLKDQILVIAPHEGFVSADVWLRCRKKLMTNTTFQNGRKARNTWLAGKIKCGKCGYALKTTHNPSGYEYLRCSKRADHKGCPGCGTLRKTEFEQFIFTAMGEKFREFKLLRGGEEKANPKITAYQVELAQVEAEIEKLLDTLTGANATLLAYANKKIEDLDNRRKTLSKAIADLSVETLSSQQIELLSGYLDDWENISFEDKRKAADGLISSISATSDYVKIEWKI